MPELEDRRDEQMARLLAVGVTADEAYFRSGRKRDRSNAAKKAKSPAIAARVAELIEEELERQRQVRLSNADVDGVDELRRALLGAASSGQWSAAVAASRALAEMDGSAGKLMPDKEMTVGELRKLAYSLGTVMGVVTDMALMLRDEDGKPLPPWTNSAGEPVGPYIDATTEAFIE